MGKHGPRRGSIAYWHRKRASRLVPRVSVWNTKAAGLTGFAGYKVGMADAVIVDKSNSPFKDQEVVKPITIVEVPPLFIYAINAYKMTPFGVQQATQVTSTAFKEAKRALTPAKKAKNLDEVEKKINEFAQLRVLALTQPSKCGVGKKKPDVVEIALGGTIHEQLATAKNILGKEVRASDVLKEGQLTDIIAVTKGKGWQGVVKRFGVALNPHKATAHRRKGGSIGPETQAKVFFTIPRAGQMGFHRRTDANKRILRISSNASSSSNPSNVSATPSASTLPPFAHYGFVKGDYVILEGSIPGPAKRFVRFRIPISKSNIIQPQVLSLQF